jgi:tetratricopeptide (TPR) repeat protein
MQIALSTAVARNGFAAVLLLLLLGYAAFIQRDYRAASWAQGADIASLQRAVEIEPRAAEYQNRAGRMLLFANQESDSALPLLRRATELNPHIPWFWLDLATAHAVQGDFVGQRAALLRASQADPKTPVVAWEVANLMLMDGKVDAALPLLRTVVENDSDSAEQALELSLRSTNDPGRVLREVTPATVDARLTLVNVLTNRGDLDSAKKVWDALAGLQQPIPPLRAMPYLDFLLKRKQLADADQVMQALARNLPALQAQSDSGATIVNPGLEEEYVPGPLSWNLRSSSAVQVQIDGNEFHSGTRSLRLEFSGPGFRNLGIAQSIRVPEHASLDLSVWVKAGQIKSPLGPRVVVQDAYTNQFLATGNEILGSSPWREERLSFTSDSGLIVFRVIRDSSDGGVSGKLWIDDLKVTPR